MKEYILKFMDSIEAPEKELYNEKYSKVARVYEPFSLGEVKFHAHEAKRLGYETFGVHITESSLPIRALVRAVTCDVYDNVNIYSLRENVPTVTPPSSLTDPQKDIFILTPYPILTFDQSGENLSPMIEAFYGEVYTYIRDAKNVKVQIESTSCLYGRQDDIPLVLFFEVVLGFLRKYFPSSNTCKVYELLRTDDSCVGLNANMLKNAALSNYIIGYYDHTDKVLRSGGSSNSEKVRANIKNISVEGPKWNVAVNPYLTDILDEMNSLYNSNYQSSKSGHTKEEEFISNVINRYTIIQEKEGLKSGKELLDFLLRVDRNKLGAYKDPAYRNSLPKKDDYSSYWGTTEIGKLHKKIWHDTYDNDEGAKAVWNDIGAVFNKKNSEGKGAIDAATEKFYNLKHLPRDVLGLNNNDPTPHYDYRTYENPDIMEKGVASIEKFKLQQQIRKNIQKIDDLEKKIIHLDPNDEDDSYNILKYQGEIKTLNDENRAIQAELSSSARDELAKEQVKNAMGGNNGDNRDVNLNAPTKWTQLGTDATVEILKATNSYNKFKGEWLNRY